VATPLSCFAESDRGARPVRVVREAGYRDWLAAAPAHHRAWLEATGFAAKPGAVTLLPAAEGEIAAALLVAGDAAEPWDAASLQAALPAGTWALEDREGALPAGAAALGWALAAYRFERYRKEPDAKPRPLLALDVADPAVAGARRVAEAVYLARDLINTPASDLGPEELAEAVLAEARRHGAEAAATVGDDLLAAGYPAVHAVGRASTRAPRLVDVRWGDPSAPRVTLVGKGVCFDTGGLDIKPSSAMLLMKKDMGGAAIMLGLASLVMGAKLPVRLRLLVPAVENSIAGDAFRPGDVLRTRAGLTVEIGNTDAEGRLILADALAEADGERPDLLLDAATLTGAARVALGPELPALFTPDDALADEILRRGREAADPLWRLPLHAPYRGYIKSSVADINNAGSKPFAGSITAALFLKEFVRQTTAWAHLDAFAWNDESRPGRPRGGEATGLRALWALLEGRYGG
jgi:leucyl aminopeptidase